MTETLGRASCPRCTRPLVVCVCARIHSLPTRTRILLLQHPRERRVGIGTARLAHLSLPDSALRVGLDFSVDPVVQAALAGSPSYVLFPRPGAIAIADLPRDRPVTLVVLDGTWSQARKLLRLNPALAALPAVAFTPRRPSGYLIRKQPAELCVSTIEALAEVLDALEPGATPGSFDRLLDPFRAMVERQRWFETEVQTRRHHRDERAPRRRARPTLKMRLEADWARLVCVQGEANAWARQDPARQDPETVHWVACRPATGERFEAVIAPRRPLAPGTPSHVGLPAERLCAGGSVEAWHQGWQAFSRPDDLLVSWGVFYRALAAADGLALAEGGMDLRNEASRLLRRRVGTVEECGALLELATPAAELDGRAGRRLAALTAVVTALRG